MVYTCRIFKSQILHPKISRTTKKIAFNTIFLYRTDFSYRHCLWCPWQISGMLILIDFQSWFWKKNVVAGHGTSHPIYHPIEYLWGFEVVPNFGQARQKGTNLHRMAPTMNYTNYMLLQFAPYIAHWIILDFLDDVLFCIISLFHFV